MTSLGKAAVSLVDRAAEIAFGPAPVDAADDGLPELACTERFTINAQGDVAREGVLRSRLQLFALMTG
jgi:hypothetical protein